MSRLSGIESGGGPVPPVETTASFEAPCMGTQISGSVSVPGLVFFPEGETITVDHRLLSITEALHSIVYWQRYGEHQEERFFLGKIREILTIVGRNILECNKDKDLSLAAGLLEPNQMTQLRTAFSMLESAVAHFNVDSRPEDLEEAWVEIIKPAYDYIERALALLDGIILQRGFSLSSAPDQPGRDLSRGRTISENFRTNVVRVLLPSGYFDVNPSVPRSTGADE
jgi:hypothetical protein